MESSSRSKAIALAVAVVVVVGAAVYAFLRPAEGWPDEGRRVVNSAGFSVVAPENFEQDNKHNGEHSNNYVRMLSLSKIGNPAAFSAMQIEPADEAGLKKKGFSPTMFQGLPAWEKTADARKTHEHARTLVFQRDGQWYELGVRAPDVEPLDSGAWAAYFDTFRTEARHDRPPDLVRLALVPATAPATAPAATLPAATRP